MAKGDKYIALTAYLEKSGKDVVKMSFKEIESVLGERLPESAYKYPALWSNSESHSIAFGWMDAGFMSQNLSIANQTVEFVKRGDIKKESNSHPKAIKKRVSVEKEDYLALHLAFYLASWGMYRGSSFLLQKDYKVHVPVVEIILEEKYAPLLGITAEGLLEDDKLDLLEDVSTRIRQAYANEQPSFVGVTNNATDTLVTKILLGALGCVPAYDRYYVQAVRQYGISVGGYDRRSVRDVAKYYLQHKDAFETVRAELSAYGTEYPMMKIMDMCLWQVAFENDAEEN